MWSLSSLTGNVKSPAYSVFPRFIHIALVVLSDPSRPQGRPRWTPTGALVPRERADLPRLAPTLGREVPVGVFAQDHHAQPHRSGARPSIHLRGRSRAGHGRASRRPILACGARRARTRLSGSGALPADAAPSRRPQRGRSVSPVSSG